MLNSKFQLLKRAFHDRPPWISITKSTLKSNPLDFRKTKTGTIDPKIFRPFWAFLWGPQKKVPKRKRKFEIWLIFWGPHKKAQNGPKIFGSIFPVFVFQKWSGLDLSADLVIKIQGDLSVMELPFSRIGICYSTFQKWGLWTVAIFMWLWSMSNEKNDMWPHKRLLNTKKSFKVQRGVYILKKISSQILSPFFLGHPVEIS